MLKCGNIKEKEVSMRQQNQSQKGHITPSRLNFEFPEEARKHLKMQAIKLGITVKELATQAIMEKLEALELLEDARIAEAALKKHIDNGSKTVAHDDMMKKVGWNDL
jgi:SOS response regulatory protein OraA/RecX